MNKSSQCALAFFIAFVFASCSRPTEVAPASTDPAWFEDITAKLGIDFVHEAGPALRRAVDHFRGVIQKQPDNNFAAQHPGECLKLQGNSSESETVCRKLTQLRPDLPDARVGLAEAQERQGKRLDALASWLQAHLLDPDNRFFQTRLLLSIAAVWC